MLLKSYNTEFDKIIIPFTDQNGRLLEIRIKITLKLTLKNNAPLRSYLSKINNTFINNAEELDIVMSMYNLLEYSDNYSTTPGSFWNYCRDEKNDSAIEIINGNRITNSKTITNKSFEYKAKLIGSTPNSNNILDKEAVGPIF